MSLPNWEPIIGIEVHVELATQSKMFCGCPVSFGKEPNVNICPVCLALPGALPVPNRQAIEWITQIGLALNCQINPVSFFHRKNYFYADLPKNYQVSQFDIPVAYDGWLKVWENEKAEFSRVGIERAHMEEDTGKSLHEGTDGRLASASYTRLDFNRSGVPLVEIVSRPDITSAIQARAFAQQLRALVLDLRVSDARLEEGSFRFDANVSVRAAGSEQLGTKVEIKNMNSFRSLEQAVSFEVDRQTKLLEGGSGEKIVQETRHWEESKGVTQSMRTKEGSSDYRYFTEPDLVPMAISASQVEELRAGLPELPVQRRERYREMGLDAQLAKILLGAEQPYREMFDRVTTAGADARLAATWITGELTALVRRTKLPLDGLGIDSERMVGFLSLLSEGDLSASAAKTVLQKMSEDAASPREIAERLDLLLSKDPDLLEKSVQEVLAAQPDAVDKFVSGEKKVVGFLVGQVIRATGGKADPAQANQLLTAALQKIAEDRKAKQTKEGNSSQSE